MKLSNQLKARLDSAKALIFDMDGTVVDSMPAHFAAWSVVAEKYDLNFSKERFYQLGGVPTYETLEILSAESNRSIDIPEAKALKERVYRSQMDNIGIIKPTIDIIKHYFGKVPLAIATGSSRIGAEKVLNQLELRHFFQAVSTSDDVVRHKPAPDVFLHAANQINVLPEHCVAFEDTDIGMKSIQTSGMFAVDVRDM
jgi:beta-phosphoglucomutase family hydrolase